MGFKGWQLVSGAASMEDYIKYSSFSLIGMRGVFIDPLYFMKSDIFLFIEFLIRSNEQIYLFFLIPLLLIKRNQDCLFGHLLYSLNLVMLHKRNFRLLQTLGSLLIGISPYRQDNMEKSNEMQTRQQIISKQNR